MTFKTKMKEIRFRCWINIDDEKYFGPGPLRLLRLIDQEGSLSKAAKAMGMSYKKAWDIVSHLNEKASEPIVLSQKGGAKGGGARVTSHGQKIMSSYLALTQRMDSVIAEHNDLLDII